MTSARLARASTRFSSGPRGFAGTVVVIAGAAGGIGHAVASALAARGAKLGLLDKDSAGLHALAQRLDSAGTEYRAFPVDIVDAVQVARVAQSVERELGRARVLVNCAGTGLLASFYDAPLALFADVVSVNLQGTVQVCHAFLPQLLAAQRPAHIVNVASLAGVLPSPFGAAYTASKHAVVGFSEALRAELATREIGVSVVCHGPVATGITERSVFFGKWRHYQPLLRRSLDGQAQNWVDRLVPAMTPQAAAQVVVRSIVANTPRAIAPSGAQLLVRFNQLLPRLSNKIMVDFARDLERRVDSLDAGVFEGVAR